ncbi:uncharacterized protein LOC131933551 [Physella acuta]|uniref:uncharacterized protein LOC131933551 n=1 Tax=Physella acuta TaxID=109671 RepID=UPI0027DAD44D|nr:uncharacterized protein LOC131933551 [Physella acuta]
MRPKHFENIVQHHKNYLDQKIIDLQYVLQILINASDLSREWLENPHHHLGYTGLNQQIEHAISSLCNEAMKITHQGPDNQSKDVTIVSQPPLQIDKTVNVNTSTAAVPLEEKVKHTKGILKANCWAESSYYDPIHMPSCYTGVINPSFSEEANSTECLFDDENMSLLNEVSSVSSVSTYEFCMKEKIQVQECFLFKTKVRKFTRSIQNFFYNIKVKRQWKKFT